MLIFLLNGRWESTQHHTWRTSWKRQKENICRLQLEFPQQSSPSRSCSTGTCSTLQRTWTRCSTGSASSCPAISQKKRSSLLRRAKASPFLSLFRSCTMTSALGTSYAHNEFSIYLLFLFLFSSHFCCFGGIWVLIFVHRFICYCKLQSNVQIALLVKWNYLFWFNGIHVTVELGAQQF